MARRASSGRLVVVGDLNGAADALIEILRGTGLVDARLRWCGGAASLVQIGDLFNRGGGARRALTLLLRLQREAKQKGGKVSILLGNHEVMTALGNEAYCTEQEYLAFASVSERKAWSARVQRAARRIYRAASNGRILPFEPRLEAWKALNAPGQAAMRRELSARGRLGKALRRLPVAEQVGELVCVHAGILPKFAALGIEGMNELCQREWQIASKRYADLQRRGLFRNPDGPLWDRSLARDAAARARVNLKRSLALLGAKRMVVGHTPTHTLAGGHKGHIHTRFGASLVLVDVGLAEGEDAPRAALLVENGRGLEWTPEGTRVLWTERTARKLKRA